jgi:hypothetical protein
LAVKSGEAQISKENEKTSDWWVEGRKRKKNGGDDKEGEVKDASALRSEQG